MRISNAIQDGLLGLEKSVGVILFTALLGSSLLHGQTGTLAIEEQKDSPIRIDGAQARLLILPNLKATTDVQLIIQLISVTNRPISAYCLALQVLGASGSVEETLGVNEMDLVAAKRERMPGTTWDQEMQLSPSTGKTVKIWIDYVKFSDGSNWGPKRLSTTAFFMGEIKGILEERTRVRTLLSKNRADLLQEELRRPLEPIHKSK